MKTTLLAVLVLLAACQTPVPPTLEPTVAMPSGFIAHVERDRASMVDVTADVVRSLPNRDTHEQWLHEFFPRVSSFAGSRDKTIAQNRGVGIIISSDGLILINAHVVRGATEITVHYADHDRPFQARIIGLDRMTDVALLKIDAVDLPIAPLGRSEQAKVGDWVAAVGSSRELTIYAGVIRAHRRFVADFPSAFIQTDLAENSPASGPLMNAKGEVIGINSGIIKRNDVGLSPTLAVPIEIALDVARHLYAPAQVRQDLGIHVDEATRLAYARDGG